MMETVIELAKILAWPVTALALALLFRSDLRTAVGRLSHLKYKGFEARFDKALAEAEASARSGALSVESLTPQGELPPAATDDSARLLRIADVSPRAAIMEAWIEVERAVSGAATAHGIEVAESMSPLRLIEALTRRKILTVEARRILDQLRELRNQAAHAPDFVLEANEAQRYLDLASGLAAYIRHTTPLRREERS